MEIRSYRFGSINIDGREYTKDLKIIRGSIVPNWWRKSGHLLQLEDITDIVEARPKVLVVGTGASGLMRIDAGLTEKLEKSGIMVEGSLSAKAVERFNKLLRELGPEKVSLAIHLTC